VKRPLILAPALVLCLFPLGVAGTAHAQDVDNSFVVELTGEAEVPGPGDSDGTGTATLTIDAEKATICYTLEVADIADAAAAHIHEAGFGVAGPVVVELEAPASGESSGCADVEQDLATDILDDPGQYYVNVHNADFPDGAVRGQLTQMPTGGVATGAGGTAADDNSTITMISAAIALLGLTAAGAVATRRHRA